MAKKHGNWPFLCNFASMKQNLPDIIRENKDLLSAMLEQEGFMKYVAEHLDDDGLTLYARYQEQVVSDYRKSNMWNPYVQLLQGNELWLKALGPDNHLTKELRLRWNLEQLFADVQEEETAETVKNFYDGYMAYAWREFFELRNPEHATNLGLYKTLMEQFSWPDGLACRCMELTLKEHHGIGWTEDDKYDYYCIAEYYYFYFDDSTRQGKISFDRLRRGVKEWLEGKSGEECRELAVDMLEKARWFSQHIYNDKSVCSLNGVPFPLEDKKWLREMARSLGKKTGIMAPYFSEFVFLLQEVGRIWAARLLKEHLIDLHTLEKETNSFLMPYETGKNGFDYHYYVDHYYTNDSPNTCCVNNNLKAKKLLYERYGKNLELELEELTGDKLDSHSSGNTRGGDNVNQGVPNVVPPVIHVVFQDVLNDDEIAKALLKINHQGLGAKQFAQAVEEFFRKIGWAADVPSTRFVEWMKGKGIIQVSNTAAPRKPKTEDAEKQLNENVANLKDILRNTFQEKNIAQIWQDKGKFYKRNDAKKINNGKPEPK